jgi:hypothetical protein
MDKKQEPSPEERSKVTPLQSSNPLASSSSTSTKPAAPPTNRSSLTAEPAGYFDNPRRTFAGPKWSTAVTPGFAQEDEVLNSPSAAAAGARSGRELLRRMSLAGTQRQTIDNFNIDPLSAYPTLGLSGNIISAVFCMPNVLVYNGKDQDWVRHTSSIYPLHESAKD